MPSATPRMLMQFEAIFLTETQCERFMKLYNEKKFDVPNPVFQSWLPLKLASLPTKSAALQAVLGAWTPTAIPKKTTKRAGRKVPEGAACFNPLSPEWKIIMETKDQSESNLKQENTKGGTKSASKARKVKEEAVPKEEEKQPKDLKGKG